MTEAHYPHTLGNATEAAYATGIEVAVLAYISEAAHVGKAYERARADGVVTPEMRRAVPASQGRNPDITLPEQQAVPDAPAELQRICEINVQIVHRL